MEHNWFCQSRKTDALAYIKLQELDDWKESIRELQNLNGSIDYVFWRPPSLHMQQVQKASYGRRHLHAIPLRNRFPFLISIHFCDKHFGWANLLPGPALPLDGS